MLRNKKAKSAHIVSKQLASKYSLLSPYFVKDLINSILKKPEHIVKSFIVFNFCR